MLQAIDIHKSYGDLAVLKGVSIELNAGELVALVGASGAGKSTLLHVMGTLDRPDRGEVRLDGKPLSTLSDRQQAAARNRELGFVFQFHHLLPEFNALENVAMPAYIRGENRSQVEERASQLLDRLGLSGRLTHRPAQLSGGEQQRVSVARALMNDPRFVLADEPTGNLDSTTSETLYRLIFDLARDMNIGFLIVTHNQDLASRVDRKYQMVDGMIV